MIPGFSYISFTTMGGSINVVRGSRPVLYLELERNRVASACFPYDLTADELRTVIAELRRAGGGLERWIIPGLEENQASGTVQRDHPEKYAILPELLESSRDLPTAAPWQRRRRELQRLWKKQLQEHPEDINKVPAPWLLPEEFTPERRATKAGARAGGNSSKHKTNRAKQRRTKRSPGQ